MRHLNWIQRPYGWQSGPYHIELLAPRLWVLSRSDQPLRISSLAPAKIEITGGSLSGLKAKADQVERRRLKNRAIRLRVGILLAAFLVLVGSHASSAPWAPLAVILTSVVSFLLLLSVADRLMRRPWDAVRDSYQ